LLLVTAAALLAIALPNDELRACGWAPPTIEELTTFEPAVLGEDESRGLYYDPFLQGLGGRCDECVNRQMVEDWATFLAGAVKTEDWSRALLEASSQELDALVQAVAAGPAPAHAPALPPGKYDSFAEVNPSQRQKVLAALAFVKLAREVEPLATLVSKDGSDGPGPAVAQPKASQTLLGKARAALARTREAFLKQRYAFQVLRLLFYRKDFSGVLGFQKDNARTLGAPSVDLSWRTRYYVAGALMRTEQRAAANLELARIHAGYAPLAGAAADDFAPMEETDWQETLGLAADVREKTELWRLVGLKQDGIAAMREIVRLDPSSDLLALLAVRELTRVDYDAPPEAQDPKQTAARRKAAALVERLAAQIADTPGADRPWLMNLVAGHLAARRGDRAASAARLSRAVAARPWDERVVDQAWASSLLAEAASYRVSEASEARFAKLANESHVVFGRIETLRGWLRAELARAYRKAGRLVEAEFLVPGSTDARPAPSRYSADPAPRPQRWDNPDFLRAAIARAGRPAAPFDRWLFDTWGAHVKPDLEQKLGLLYLERGQFAASAHVFRTTDATSSDLGTDPFVIHIRDCHDCDHAAYGSSPWTQASFAARLAELEVTARGSGESAAEASLLLGNAMYNLSWYGNARALFNDYTDHRFDVTRAERWYQRAFDLTRQRELKSRAAYDAAKAELGSLLERDDTYVAVLPVPTHWFGVLSSLSDTAYHREVLAECSHYRRWWSRTHAPDPKGRN
jgi:hypothetical protein